MRSSSDTLNFYMNDNHQRNYLVILSRSDAIAPFPRLESAARCLNKCGLSCLAVGWDRESRHLPLEEKDGFSIIRRRFPGQYGGGFLRNIWGLLCFNLWLLYLYLKLRPRVIHAYDFDTVIPALISRIFIKNILVYDIADWYAASRRVGPLKQLVEISERWVCRKADVVILAHEKRIQQLGFIPRKWLAIYNTPTDYYDSFNNIKQVSNDYFVYVGVLQKDRGLEQIIKSTSRLGLKLIIAGFGSLESYCKKLSFIMKNVEFLGKIPYEKTLELERNAIGIIALYDPRLSNNQLAAPNKLYEAMMLGRPLITSRGTLVGEFVEQKGIGIAVNYQSIEELTQALDHLRSNLKVREEMGLRARRLYEKEYSFKKQCKKLVDVYRELCPVLLTSLSEGE